MVAECTTQSKIQCKNGPAWYVMYKLQSLKNYGSLKWISCGPMSSIVSWSPVLSTLAACTWAFSAPWMTWTHLVSIWQTHCHQNTVSKLTSRQTVTATSSVKFAKTIPYVSLPLILQFPQSTSTKKLQKSDVKGVLGKIKQPKCAEEEDS